ncbi:MAG: hypothetical protein O7C63_03315 [Alphaproteobacteria bacterium]|nr:hypothetical protein [Alphaproteobacteria bacterium]
MIHFIISFCYVMAGTAAALLLPQLFGWVRADLATFGAAAVVLAAANIHYFIAQIERARRTQHGLDSLRARLVEIEGQIAGVSREVKSAVETQHDTASEGARAIARTVEEVHILQGLLERFVHTQQARSKKARLADLVARRPRPDVPLPRRGGTGSSTPAPGAPASRGNREPEPPSVTEPKSR